MATAEWFENDAFWEEMYPYMFSEERMNAGLDEVAQLVELTGIAGGAVLDVCCGPARHALPLAERGFSVTGVDRSAYLLERARQRLAAASVDAELVQQDMRQAAREQAFDLAVSLFTSFGYYGDPVDNQAVLRSACRSLKDGGKFVVDLSGKETLARGFAPSEAERHADGALTVQLRRLVDGWSRMESEWVLVRDGHESSYPVHLCLYSATELRDMLHRAGFAQTSVYGSLGGSPYDQRARRLVAVATK